MTFSVSFAESCSSCHVGREMTKSKCQVTFLALFFLFVRLSQPSETISNQTETPLDSDGSGPDEFIVYSTGVSLKMHSGSATVPLIDDSPSTSSQATGQPSFSFISALDFLVNSRNNLTLFWVDSPSRSVYFGFLDVKKRKLFRMRELVARLAVPGKDWIRGLTIDSLTLRLYVSLYNEGKIRSFDLNTFKVNSSIDLWEQNYLSTNLTKPGQMVTDSRSRFLFVVENSSRILKFHLDDHQTEVIYSSNFAIKSLSLDSLYYFVYWITNDGAIYRCKYDGSDVLLIFNETATLFKSNNISPFSLYVFSNKSSGSLTVYLSDFKYKALAYYHLKLNENEYKYSLFKKEIMNIDHPSIYAFVVINNEQLSSCRTYLTNSTKKPIISVDMTVAASEDKPVVSAGTEILTIVETPSALYLFAVSSVILLILGVCLLIVFKKFYSGANRVDNNLIKNENNIKKDSSEQPKSRSSSVKRKNYSASPTVCIEDLGGFTNYNYFESCSKCPLKKTCDVCDYKDECIEKGLCMSSYRLLQEV